MFFVVLSCKATPIQAGNQDATRQGYRQTPRESGLGTSQAHDYVGVGV